MKIPNLSACAGSASPTVTQVKIEHATDANEAKKHRFDKLLFDFIFSPFLYKIKSFRGAPGTRTQNQRIKSPMRCQLRQCSSRSSHSPKFNLLAMQLQECLLFFLTNLFRRINMLLWLLANSILQMIYRYAHTGFSTFMSDAGFVQNTP